MTFHCNHCGKFEAEMDVFSQKWRAWDGERIDTVAIPKDSCPKCGRLCWEVLAYLYRKQASAPCVSPVQK